MRLALLTGAGASFGANNSSPRPPLGKDLFVGLQRAFPATWGSLPEPCASALANDFEQGMEFVYETQQIDAPVLMIHMARFFAQFAAPPTPSNCYLRLMRTIVELDIQASTGWGTLNYECLQEVAAHSAGLPLVEAGFDFGEESPGQMRYFKLHGSCNYMLRTNIQMLGNVAHNLITGPPLAAIPPWEVEALYVSGYSLPPVMSIYMRKKHSQVSQDRIYRIWKEWAEWVTGSDVVIVIGARPLLHEAHIWRPVIDSGARVWYVGDLSDLHTKFLEGRIGKRFEPLASLFNQAIEIIIARLRTLAAGT